LENDALVGFGGRGFQVGLALEHAKKLVQESWAFFRSQLIVQNELNIQLKQLYSKLLLFVDQFYL
jgi:hypothetical protein